ncbi:hypothetical protein [Streptodolium elevatio]|uniref:ABM domain-containing protein n=1 Tax=Streptodolium elevatio TaxID=3157996 RepID=A0ABV3DNU1_9ACTN
MSVVRIVRFKADPADTEEMLTRRAAMVDVVRAKVPGLVEARLSRLEDGTWMDQWHYRTPEDAAAAVADADRLPEVRAAFALVTEPVGEMAEIVDVR